MLRWTTTPHVRLISRSDGSLALALLVATVILFQRPLHTLLEIARDVEIRYQVDLLPALAVLLTVFLLHDYRKRQEIRAEARAAAAEAAQVRLRLEELERLMTFGQALTNALDRAAMQQVLWRHLPAFAHDRKTWILLARPGDEWDPLLLDASAPDHSREVHETLATETLASVATADPAGEGAYTRDDQICFAMRAGDRPIGVMGVSHGPPLDRTARGALGTAATLIGIAVRNMELLRDAREHALRDSLTGCVNHAHGLRVLEAELRRANRTGRPLSILMIDIDHFKQINDQFGHQRGDAVLAAVGAQITRTVRTSDTCCRYGGDEFLLILPDTPLPGAEQVAVCLRGEIAGLRVDTDGRTAGALTASVGITGAGTDDTDALALVARADEALYRAKRDGRDRFCLQTPPAADVTRAAMA